MVVVVMAMLTVRMLVVLLVLDTSHGAAQDKPLRNPAAQDKPLLPPFT